LTDVSEELVASISEDSLLEKKVIVVDLNKFRGK
jgi:hypothetical protein